MDVANSSSKMDKFWVDSPNQCHYDRNLNFTAIGSEDDEAYSSFSKKTKSARDPQSHRIIEKRRRDRMNNCLADLSRLLPAAYMKKGRGRIEKTEIIEMTIKHMKHLQIHACKEMDTCEIAVQMEQLHGNTKSDQYRSGFLECISETVQFIGHHQSDQLGPFYAGDDFCSRLVAHLHNHYDKIGRGEGTGSETGDFPAGGTAATLNARNGQLNGAGTSTNDEDNTNIPNSVNCTAPVATDQFKQSHDSAEAAEAAEEEKIKQERVEGMFNYLNGATSAAQLHRQQQQHSNGNRPTRSSSGSGGDSDESRSNRATRNSDTPSPGNPTTDGSSPTDMENSSHSGGSNHSSSRSGTSSQLRQMLLASNGETMTTTTSSRTKSCSSSGSSCRSNTTQHSNTDDSNNMYKFKTNIHQRFTADLEHVFPQSSCLMTPSSTSSLPEQNSHQPQQAMDRSFEQQFHGIKRKKSDCENGISRHNGYVWNDEAPPPPPPSSPSSRNQRLHSEDGSLTYGEIAVQQQQQASNLSTPQPTENVPIFALHPKGAFYVPMSVELPLIRALFNPPTTEGTQSLLHPVTISVNFCHPLRVLTAAVAVANIETSTALNSVHHSSVIQPPTRIPRPEVLLPALVQPPLPIVHHQRHHQHPYEIESSGSNCYPLPIEDGSRIRGREHGRSSLSRHPDELKMFRTPQRDEGVYSNGIESRRHEYAVIRSSREHGGSRSPAVIPTTATHSSRWSHLMAKRTHTP